MKIFCPIRKIWLESLPEERVRQNIIRCMISEWGYPPELISCEKELKELCGQKGASVPNRRLDIVAFYTQGSELRPLFVIECKADRMTKAALRQLVGYNYFINAPFIGIGTKDGLVCWQKNQEAVQEAPTYSLLTSLIK